MILNKYVFLLLIVLISSSLGKIGKECVTPNKETGKCLSVYVCEPILNAIKTRNVTAFRFAKESNCGYDAKTPLVCCGSIGHFENIDVVTKNPPFPTYFPSTTTTLKPTTITTRRTTITFPPTQSTTTSTTTTLLADRKTCGRQIHEDRIVGGELAGIDEFPWLALLRYKFLNGGDAGFKCGGSVINNQYILTAAHCVSGSFEREFSLNSVRLGEWNITSSKDCSNTDIKYQCADPILDLSIQKIIRHPYFQSTTGNNDIALLKLDRRFEFTNYIRPICLSTDDSSETNVYMVAGWGQTDYFGENSPVKLKVRIPLVPSQVCKVTFEKRNITITNNMVCAGGEEGKDSCKGDSGGPLMTATRSLQWFQRGIVSKGVACGLPDIPAIYTKVSRYYKWILNNIRKYGY